MKVLLGLLMSSSVLTLLFDGLLTSADFVSTAEGKPATQLSAASDRWLIIEAEGAPKSALQRFLIFQGSVVLLVAMIA